MFGGAIEQQLGGHPPDGGTALDAVSLLASRTVGRKTNFGRLQTKVVDARSVIFRAREIYLFTEGFSAGVAEGVLIAGRRPGFVAQQMHGPTSADFFIRWE